MHRISRICQVLTSVAVAVCVSNSCANAADADPFWNEKSSECQFLAGAWEGYLAGLTVNGDKDREYKKQVGLWFHRLQRGVAADVHAYEKLKRQLGDTDEHKALFLQVEKVARQIDTAFEKRFSKPTRLGGYMRWSQKEANGRKADHESHPHSSQP